MYDTGHSSFTMLFVHPSSRSSWQLLVTTVNSESDLKKEWKTKSMEARSEPKKQANQTSHNGKRKMTVAEGANDDRSSATNTKAKKAKGNDSTTKSTNISTSSKSNWTSATTGAENTAVEIASSPRTKQTARCSSRGGTSNVSFREVEDKADTTEKPPRKKQTARRGGIKLAPRLTSPEKPSTPQNKPKKKQTARRGGGVFGGKQIDGDIEMKTTYDFNECEPAVSASSQSLGLINGVYEIRSDALDQWSGFPQDEFALILCLSGNAVWGEYDFGMYHGVLYIPNRPHSASQDMVPFTWRGRERSEGEMSFGEDNEGYIYASWINCYGHAKFIGWRTSGNSERSVASMRDEWNGYNSDEYERERVARWH
ncbi:hypothetical protein V1524DRAFT_473530 [Lipomyces starkeyi]